MIKLLSGDCRDVLATLPAESVQCVVTSPPYYGLRDYGTALWDGGDAACSHAGERSTGASTLKNDGRANPGILENHKVPGVPFRDTCGKCGAVRVDRQIGLEATPDEYLATMVGVFREVRRVLRRDGTCWVNLGDAYAGSFGAQSKREGEGIQAISLDRFGGNKSATRKATDIGYKPKDLMLMPARLALALQADGWWVRSDIIWHKPNPMPESCRDRPTSAHEHVFLLTKSARYYYDAEAVREDSGGQQGAAAEFYRMTGNRAGRTLNGVPSGNEARYTGREDNGSRNLRNVWTIATSPYPNAHFATYPPELAERCIKAGTSERGCCAACGKPWVRVTEHTKGWDGSRYGARLEHRISQGGGTAASTLGSGNGKLVGSTTTTGWRPSCTCDLLADLERPADPVPCTVLDPFAGAGTTLLVADRLQRDAIGIELNTAYTEMAMERCRADAPLFTSFPPAEDPEETRMADLFTDMAAD